MQYILHFVNTLCKWLARLPILGTGRGRIPAFFLVPDEGPDRVFHRLDTGAGRLVPVGDAPAREGAGPRHVALHPSYAFAYAVNELDSTVTAYRFEPEAGNLHPFRVVSALPDMFIGHSRAAEITVSSDGRFVYASNRGHDGIATLAVDPASRRLARVGWTNSLGRTPRFFTPDPTGSSVVVANETATASSRSRSTRGPECWSAAAKWRAREARCASCSQRQRRALASSVAIGFCRTPGRRTHASLFRLRHLGPPATLVSRTVGADPRRSRCRAPVRSEPRARHRRG